MNSDDMQFDKVEFYLRAFVNPAGDKVNYDYVGAFRPFHATLANLAVSSLDADIHSLRETGFRSSYQETLYLQRLLLHLRANS